jgi:hypothetical protein
MSRSSTEMRSIFALSPCRSFRNVVVVRYDLRGTVRAHARTESSGSLLKSPTDISHGSCPISSAERPRRVVV